MGAVVIPKLELFNIYLNLFGKKARHKEILIKHKAFHLFRFEAHFIVPCSILQHHLINRGITSCYFPIKGNTQPKALCHFRCYKLSIF